LPRHTDVPYHHSSADTGRQHNQTHQYPVNSTQQPVLLLKQPVHNITRHGIQHYDSPAVEKMQIYMNKQPPYAGVPETDKSKCDMIYNINSTEGKNMRRGYSRQRKFPSQRCVEAGGHRSETGTDILESYYRKYPSQRTINETMGNSTLTCGDILASNNEDVWHVYTEETSKYNSKERRPNYLPRKDLQRTQIEDLSQNQSFFRDQPKYKKEKKKTDIRIGTFNVQSIKGNMTYAQKKLTSSVYRNTGYLIQNNTC
jgi:hypothetical protein